MGVDSEPLDQQALSKGSELAVLPGSSSFPNAPSALGLGTAPDEATHVTASEHSEDDGSDDDHNPAEKFLQPQTEADKKRQDVSLFHSWLSLNRDSIDEPAAKNSRPQPNAAITTDSSGRARILETPREYQIDLFERAKEKNTIVVLDTGAGKTLIAVLLLRHTLDQELERRASGHGKKTAFFIVEKLALCFQQFTVLESNLEHPIAKIHGDLAGMTNTKEFWESQFSDNMAVVTTAQVLLGCLNSGFISMKNINLLIFDEAHHAKKNHPFAKIIRGHYMREPVASERPRLLGLTASPVDAQTRDMRAAAAELEAMLCGEIATVSNEVLSRSLQMRQLVESVENFKRLIPPEESRTALWHEVSAQASKNTLFDAALDFTMEASSTLGPWCADRFWSLLLADSEIAKLVAKSEGDGQDRTVKSINDAVSAVYRVRELIGSHHFEPVVRSTLHISSKVEALWQVLDSEFRCRGASRCIVFVEKRYTAVLVADLLQQPGMQIPGVNPSYLIGSQSSASSMASMTLNEQVATLNDFRNGTITCLVTTPVAEEGIDIPACDLVLRFDMYNTVIQYIQSKGRARQVSSRFISMVEEGNMKDLRRLKQAVRDMNALQNFCSALPEDRKAQDSILDTVTMSAAERIGQATYEIETTGARLSFENSMEVLARFTSSLATQGGENPCPDYVVTVMGKKFAADVILPETSPVICLSGFPQRSKQMARFSAAYEMCLVLLEKKHLDDHLQPTFTKRLPSMRNARLALNSARQTQYSLRKKPRIWSALDAKVPSHLYPTALVMVSPSALRKPTRPLLLMTRQRLPEIASISLFFEAGHSSPVKLVRGSHSVDLSLDQVHVLRSFTLRVFDDIFSKRYTSQVQEMPYFFAPCAETHETVVNTGVMSIPWQLLSEIERQPYHGWEGKSAEFFHDRLVMDPLDGSRKFVIHGINSNLRPGDPVPAGAPAHKSRAYRNAEANIKEYSNSLFTRSRESRQWRDDQPVVNAELLPLRRNFLIQLKQDRVVHRSCALILEPLAISTLPIDVVNMALLLPSILHRLESALIAQDACDLLDLAIQPDLALEAITKGNENDPDEDVHKPNKHFEGELTKDYERLEFLGDSFLKMATTISLFTLYPGMNEYEYHVERMLLICNKNLFGHAIGRNLHEFIRFKGFDRRSWYPNLKLEKGKVSAKERRYNVADKTIADVCEALIGAAYLSYGDGDMDMATKAVTRMVGSKNHSMESFGEYYAAYKVPQWQSAGQATETQRVAVDSIKDRIGYSFRCPVLLRSAFKHPAYTYEPAIPNYQRLEFLGDALLDMAAVDYLFRKFPTADPQWLTEHKMDMVSNQFLGFLCVHLGLHRHILVTSAALVSQRAEYANDLERAKAAAEAAAAVAGDPSAPRDFWTDAPQPPKVLADVVEALIGAMFVDSKYDHSVVERFFKQFILPHFGDMTLHDALASKHPITLLTNRLRNDLSCFEWRLCSTDVPCGVEEGAKAMTESETVCALLVHGKVVQHAKTRGGRDAKAACAKRAFVRFSSMDKAAYKAETGCDCTHEAVEAPN